MNYYKLTFSGLDEKISSEILVAFLAEYGYESFEEDENSLTAYIQEDIFKEEDLKSIEFLKPLLKANKIKRELIEDQNWNAVWESNYDPVRIKNCFIRAPFHKEDPDARYNILLSVKMAFGTAHHETTSMMIEYILENDFNDKSVLDMGSGTAVLAILASMKGAADLYAIDNDEWAYSNAEENCKLNNISNIHCLLGDADNLKDLQLFDIVFANINKNILLRDINRYSMVMKKGSDIYFSGFYEEDLDDIINECNKNSLEFVSKKVKNNWTSARFKKL
ncbi:MAG: 50S ribosomal protein L11 methyltransferase [Marinilabiliales bacterium]|nr:MAG: 50S ribosomal protein L11 methyltransferase [Marinilabiliales bacterium]